MKKTKIKIPDITEFTDDDGKKWIQTSADDLFSMQELNEVLESVEKDTTKEEIVLARIDFQKVDKEYYNAAIELQKKLNKQTDLLKKIINESRGAINRKNEKLRELIDYIKKIHALLSYLNIDRENIEKISLPAEIFSDHHEEIVTATESVYEEVEEIPLKLNGSNEDQLH